MSKFLIFALFILVVIFVVRWQMGQYQNFMDCAGKATGKVVSKVEKPHRPDNQSGRMEYTLTYSYTVDGVDYTSSDTVEYKELWLDLVEGQELEIYYSKKDPKKAYPVVVMDRRLGGTPASYGEHCP